MQDRGFVAAMVAAVTALGVAVWAARLAYMVPSTPPLLDMKQAGSLASTSDLATLSDRPDQATPAVDMKDAAPTADGSDPADAHADGSDAHDAAGPEAKSEYQLGCFAWSEKRSAALCVIGNFTNECFTHDWSWSLSELPSKQVLATDSGTLTPEDRDSRPQAEQSRDHMRALPSDVDPTMTEGQFSSSLKLLAELAPRSTLDMLLETESGKPAQWLRLRWAQTSAGKNRISMRCLPQEQAPPDLIPGGSRSQPTSAAPPIPKGVRSSEVDVFAYEGGQTGTLSIYETPTKNRLVAVLIENTSQECQSSTTYSASVLAIGSACSATSDGDAAAGLRSK